MSNNISIKFIDDKTEMHYLSPKQVDELGFKLSLTPGPEFHYSFNYFIFN